GAGLDVLVARKLGAPGQPEFAFGAIAHGVRVLDRGTVQRLRLSEATIAAIEDREEREAERRERAYRDGRPAPRIEGRTVLVVDDGLATGLTARAALRAVRAGNPARLVFAAPVGPKVAIREHAGECD